MPKPKKRKPSKSRSRGGARLNPEPTFRQGLVGQLAAEAREAILDFFASRDSYAVEYAILRAREGMLLAEIERGVDTEKRSEIESILGMSLFYRHLLAGREHDLSEALDHLERTAADPPREESPVRMVDMVYVWALSLRHKSDPSPRRREKLLTEAWARCTPKDMHSDVGLAMPGELSASIHVLATEDSVPSAGGPRRTELRQSLVRLYRASAAATGKRELLDRAIEWSDTLRDEPERDLSYSWTQLDRAACLALRYEAGGDLTDLNLAIEACERGIEATLSGGFDPEEAHLAYQWFELGLCRRMRGERTKRAEDFEESLRAYQAGFELVGADDPTGVNGYQALLGTAWGRDKLADENSDVRPVLSDDWLDDPTEGAFVLRWNLARQNLRYLLDDERVEEARSAMREVEGIIRAFDHLPARQLDALTDISGAWFRLFELTGNDADRINAVAANETVLQRADLREPHEQANLWRAVGYLRAVGGELEEAYSAYEAGLTSMQVAVRGAVSRADQEHLLDDLSGLVSDVVVAACRTDRPDRASEVAWYSMGMLYREATRRRALVHAASESDAAVAAELRDLYRIASVQWTRLDSGLGFEDDALPSNARRSNAERIKAIAREFETALEEPEGLDDGQPQDADANANGSQVEDPIKVVICVSHLGVEALVFMEEQLWCSYGEDRRENINEILDLYAAVLDGDVVEEEADAALKDVLSAVGEGIFQPIVSWVRERSGSSRPRVQFCLSGRLGTLPLGAVPVTIKHGDGTKAAVLTDALSFSLIPALSAYLPDRHQSSRESLAPSLIAAAWQVHGRAVLIETREEARDVVALLRPGLVSTLGLEESRPATYDAVVEGLRTASHFHYTGHADIDYQHPDLSYLVLQDSAERRLTAGAIAELELSHGRLAFLSACAVGHTRGRLRDDPFDLGSAFLYAGFDQVVAPLRPIPDQLAREAAVAFYVSLLSGSDTSDRPIDAKAAFDEMTASLRASHGDDVLAWAGFALLESPAAMRRADLGNPTG